MPLNAKTNVRVEAVGRQIMIFLNDSVDVLGQLSGDRITGSATVYASDPWHPTASAKLSNIKMDAIKAFSPLPLSNVNGALTKGSALEKTTVPADYALSFDITPLGKSDDWTNIIHYAGEKNARIPGKNDGYFG